MFALEEKMDGTLHVSREVADVKLWSAEEPYLYELRMEVYDAAGNLQEVVAIKDRLPPVRDEGRTDAFKRKADCV